MQTILVPTDFSKNAEYALDVAYQIAFQTKSDLYLLNVCQLNEYSDPVLNASVTANYMKQTEENISQAMEDIITLEKYAQVMIRPIVEFGGLAQQINATATRIGAKLIIMGTKGASGLNEFFLGSNTERLVRTAECPVLAVPYNLIPFKLNVVLVPTTLQPNQAVVFDKLVAWQQIFGFEVCLLYINNAQNYQEYDNPEARANELATQAGLKKYAFYTASAFQEEEAIFEFAEQRKADMIVMGTNQRRGLTHLFLGSLTEDVVNQAMLPILSISLRKH